MDKSDGRPKEYNTPKLYASTKLWAKTLRKFRMISAARGETMVVIFDRIADRELSRIRKSESRETEAK